MNEKINQKSEGNKSKKLIALFNEQPVRRIWVITSYLINSYQFNQKHNKLTTYHI